MPAYYKKKIENRELSVIVATNETDAFEFVLTGKEANNALQQGKISQLSIIMWELFEDPEGSEAEKVFNLAVELLEKGKPVEEVLKKMDVLITQINIEEKNIDKLIRSLR